MQFPVAPAPFTGECREVDPGAVFDWLRHGWASFMDHPAIWLGSAVLMVVMLLSISIVPLFGQLAVNMLLPMFAAGLLQICRHQAEENEPQIGDLFAGFRHNAGSLVTVGLIYTAGVFGVAALGVLLVSGGVLGGVVTGRVGGVGIALGGVMLAGLLVLILSLPVIMATWFAPALVYFHDMKPVPAMKASFAAGMKNWLAMSVFGVLLMVAMFFALLPLAIGMLLLLPVFSGAAYASYKDIFVGA